MNMKLEVIIIPVSDVDRAKAFYEKLEFRFDGDFADGEKLRVVQLTPPRSETSIIFGKGITSAKPGSTDSLVLAVDNVDAARAELIAGGAKVSEVFHYAGLPFNKSTKLTPVIGAMPALSCDTPNNSKNVGAYSMKLTKSFTRRPGCAIPCGQQATSGTWFDAS